MEFIKAKKKIASFWFVFCGIIFVLMIVQSLNGKFEDKVSEAWGWIFPSILPTLSLILGVFLIDIKNSFIKKKTIDIFYYRLTLGLSFFYLFTVLSILLSQPLIGKPIISLMKESNIFLGPIQGLVNVSMGLFFIKND